MGWGVREFSHLEVWAPNLLPAEAEPLPPAAFHPPSPPPPPPSLKPCLTPRRGREVGGGQPAAELATPTAPMPSPACTPPSPGPRW